MDSDEIEDTIDSLRYIAESPSREHGGFHPEAVRTAVAALRLIEWLRAEPALTVEASQ